LEDPTRGILLQPSRLDPVQHEKVHLC
jgi:hypothetical protein